MSIDSFLAALGRGAGMHRPRLVEALRTGAVFGVIEMLTPLLGWAAGMTASAYIAAVDHWIAFGLLAAVGGRMIVNGIVLPAEKPAEKVDSSLLVLLATALGTSIDAMAVGVSLALLDVNILVIAAAIGTTTFLLSTGGILMGRMIGLGFGRWAEIGGGLALTGLGLSILLTHLNA